MLLLSLLFVLLFCLYYVYSYNVIRTSSSLKVKNVYSYGIRISSSSSLKAKVEEDDEMIPPPPPGQGEWDDWDGTEAAIGDNNSDYDNDENELFTGSGILTMLNTLNDDNDNDDDDIIIKNKSVETLKEEKKKLYKDKINNDNIDNFHDDEYDDDRINLKIEKGAGAFSPSGKSDKAFSNPDGRGPMDNWGEGYSEESPYFDEDDIIDDWSDRKGTFNSMSSDLFAKPNIDEYINKEGIVKEVIIDNPSTPAVSQSTVLEISLLTIANDMNKRLNEIEMKSTIQYQDLKLFFCGVSALQLIIILLLIK